ncbi:MAG: Omp28-related outer membrane protein [Saprospiraceae bacterium]|nr:Omp28-related outer membrane protein [Saprospiraceae bacterium]
MKKLLFTFALTACFLVPEVQSQAKKYALIEHFTNSNCSTCAQRNPALYTLIGAHPDDVHHIAYHPSFPYPSCIFYQANMSENTARTNYYGVVGTPKVALNGTLVNGGSQLLPAATLNAALLLTSPIQMQVTETSGTNRTATVQIYTHGTVPEGSYKLYLAVVEKTVIHTSPVTGATDHRDVFRTMLPAIDGTPVTLAQPGGNISLSFNYSVASGWNAAEVYVVAFVQNTTTKEVLNSGTRFDSFVLSTGEPRFQTASVQPNPVSETAVAYIGDDRAESLEVFAINGQRTSVSFENQQVGGVSFSMAGLPRGIYVLKVTGEKGVYTAKVVKS